MSLVLKAVNTNITDIRPMRDNETRVLRVTARLDMPVAILQAISAFHSTHTHRLVLWYDQKFRILWTWNN